MVRTNVDARTDFAKLACAFVNVNVLEAGKLECQGCGDSCNTTAADGYAQRLA